MTSTPTGGPYRRPTVRAARLPPCLAVLLYVTRLRLRCRRHKHTLVGAQPYSLSRQEWEHAYGRRRRFRGALTLVVDVVLEHAGVRLTTARHQAREAGAPPLRGRARRRAQHAGQLTDYSAGQSSQVCVPAVVCAPARERPERVAHPLWENYGRTSHSQSWSTPKTFVA